MANNSSKAAVQAFAQSYCALIVIVLCILVVITPTNSHLSKQKKTEQLADVTIVTDNTNSLKEKELKKKIDKTDYLSEIDYSQLFAPDSSEINQELLTTLLTVLSAHDLIAEINIFVRSDNTAELSYERAVALAYEMEKNNFNPTIAKILIKESHQFSLTSNCKDCQKPELTVRFLPEHNQEA